MEGQGEGRSGLETSSHHVPRPLSHVIATSCPCLLEAFCLIQLTPPVIRLLCVRNPRSDQRHHVGGTGWRGGAAEKRFNCGCHLPLPRPPVLPSWVSRLWQAWEVLGFS